MADEALGGILPAGQRSEQGARPFGEPRQAPRDAPPPPAAGDRIELSAGETAALQLLRERVLARTRQQLELPEATPAPNFADLEGRSLHGYLGRLLSAQNLLAGARAGQWPPDRIRSAIAAAFTGGAVETLELLAAVGKLDEAAHELLAELLADFAARCAPEQTGG